MTTYLTETVTGISNNFSFEEAFKDALNKTDKNLPTDHFKYVVTETGYIEGGFSQVKQLYVTIKRVEPQ